jgi:hypothetical protein
MDFAVRAVAARTYRTLFSESIGIKCNPRDVVSPREVFNLLWAGWSCEIASEASVVGVCRWKRSGLSGRDNNGAA